MGMVGRHRQGWELALFLGPALLMVLVWRFIPLAYNFFLSFTSWPMLKESAPKFIGLKNYVDLLVDPRFLNTLKVTLLFTGISTLVELLLGVAFALVFDKQMRLDSVLRSIVTMPMIITPAVVGTMWYIIYHPTIGPLNYFLNLLGLPSVNWLNSASTALLSIIIADVWNWTPFMFLLVLSAMQAIPPELYEAAKVDGASGVRLFRYVTLPQISLTLLVALILRSMDNLRIFDKIFVLTGGGPGRSTETLNVMIYKTAFGSFELGYAASIVTVFLIIVAVLYAINMRFTTFQR